MTLTDLIGMTTFTTYVGTPSLALQVLLKFTVDNIEKHLGFGINITLTTITLL